MGDRTSLSLLYSLSHTHIGTPALSACALSVPQSVSMHALFLFPLNYISLFSLYVLSHTQTDWHSRTFCLRCKRSSFSQSVSMRDYYEYANSNAPSKKLTWSSKYQHGMFSVLTRILKCSASGTHAIENALAY